jgi:hypothetical protein
MKTTIQRTAIVAALTLSTTISVMSAALASAKVCIEAEGASSLQSPLKKVMPGPKPGVYSGRGYIEIPWDRNLTKGQGQATIKFTVKTAGVYYVWARTLWANGCGNSVAVKVNGSDDKILGEDGTYDRWHWVGGAARVTLKAGANTIVLKNRETGVKVDQFFFTQDGDYTPTGPRKITS